MQMITPFLGISYDELETGNMLEAHIWHIFDKSDEPRETKIGSLKHAFGDKTYRFADKVDSLTLLLKEMFGQVVRDLKTKRQKNPEPEPTAPTEDPYLPTTSVSTGLTENVQPPNIDSMFNPEEIPFPPGFNPAPPPTSDPSPPKPNPTTPTGGPYFPISLGTTVKGDLPATTSSIGKLVLIDSEGKSTDLTPKQVVSVGKYFDNLLNGSN
ncbi:hypothetical protein KQX54_003218 [Cotesia glomerata]|uniref:Uncharacterized protein n=1 Tax=Cotesia glomerata TaxID=32391 RepID=A0AAV7IEH5_COTGL|nr:hypothetical protein KQX54_003218 [Cotesia glomerata]